ncbi:hypothetical protein FH972_007163 [Carpinus fangiana]|uniref:SET domain-containing protein n=1 Tax=Carpinus fangiana TaxID=176857 RepID=A0A5N6QUT6_9ROSI|nr:hypothetical protein FH972_007163 [Carpinus fangiana]
MALQSHRCVEDSTKFEAPEFSRRESARIKDKRIAEKELQVRQRVELLNEQPDVAGEGGRRKRIKHCYSRRASVKNAHGEVEKISEGFEEADKPMNLSLEAENRAVTENGTASTFEKSDYAKVKETLRVFNKHYLHFVQEEEKRCGKADAEKKASKASKSKKRAAREEKNSKPSKVSKSKIQAAPENTKNRTKRPDLKAMMEANEILNPVKRIGDIPGIKVGHQFYARAEMVAVGFHSHWLNGIDYMGQSYSKGEYRNYTFPVAVAIVLSGMYEDDLDNADDVVYTGQGGHNLTGNKHQIQDQKMELIRGHESKSSYTGKVYTYDGLYKVVKYWAEKGLSGFTVFKYCLRRLEGQPLLTTNQVHFTRGRVPQSVSEIRGLVCEDITGGEEVLPIPATNLVDDPPYCKSIQVVKNVQLPNNASGCNCKGMCVDPKTCACAMLNGSDFPYVSRDGGRLIEAKDVVFECGPKCGCGPDCANRTSQRGLKYRLEVFRTPKKGWAVRSWDFIPSGAPVCEYTGILMRTQDLDSVSENNYIFEIDCLQTMRGLGGRERRFRDVSVPTSISEPTIISSDRPDDLRSENIPEFCIDAGSTGNIARFINHCCEPNLFVQCVLSSHHDIKLARVMLFAADNIPPLQVFLTPFLCIDGSGRPAPDLLGWVAGLSLVASKLNA